VTDEQQGLTNQKDEEAVQRLQPHPLDFSLHDEFPIQLSETTTFSHSHCQLLTDQRN
jgi:hypothetical protein